MTNNINRAADVIDAWTKQGHELNSHVGSPYDIARRLADAGLLAADRIEYGITFAHGLTVCWVGDGRDAAEGLREAWINRGAEVGPLVCRRVSEPWEVTNER